MNLTQLTYFQHLAKRQHLLQTAESLHVSPSTVSASLKSLEEELGTPLFERKGRGMRLNRQGEIFLPYVDQLFSLLAQGEQAVRESLGQQPRDFSFSLKYTAFYHDIVPLLLNLYPEMTIHHYDMDTDDRGSLMWEKDLDLMITAKDFSANNKLTYETISVDPFCLAVNPDHWGWPAGRAAGWRSCGGRSFSTGPRTAIISSAWTPCWSSAAFGPVAPRRSAT